MIHHSKDGYIYLITGSMYAGKTTELMRILNRFTYANYKILLFTLDSRFGKMSKSHDGISIQSHYIEHNDRVAPQKLKIIIDELNPKVIGFDEIQFLNKSFVSFFKELAISGKIVVLAGLDQDFRGEPFETTMLAFVESEYIKKINAICNCGNPAIRNYRKVENNEIEFEGGIDEYEAKCRICYDKLK